MLRKCVSEKDDSLKSLVYFIKSLPIDDVIKRKHVESFKMFSKEWFMYSELLPQFRKGNDESSNQWHANCYLARQDLLVLDDLTAMGYRHIEYRARFNTPLINCCLKNVAKLHAASIEFDVNVLGDEKFEEKFAEYLIEHSITEDNQWFLCGLRAIKGCVPLAKNFYKYKDQWSDEEFDHRIKKTYEIVKPSKVFQNVVCHQDLWANNIMFKFEKKLNSNELDFENPVNCTFMDFQFYKYAPPAIDVLQLLLMTTRLNYRSEKYEEHFRFYHNCLSDELKLRGFDVNEILSWSEFRLSCDELRIYPIIYNCVAQPLIYLQPEKQLSMKNDAEKFHHILMVNRMDYMLDAMAADDQFKEVIMENIEELLDCIFGENTNKFIL
ncbi:hypothetical protein Bhyg_09569 [Pseudolycoriella hygida]|uniref:CHK kinase-like domain-containing protein n=1 Tax=Pseudolycoriella hygida TaxID=35572 RepID=A0A9Q0N6X9_9DIPT|nr:hypothetical protein Bhyg_09569 [Pseudolycoriella hygida]